MRQVTLPWAPGVNSMYRRFRRRVTLSAKARSFHWAAEDILTELGWRPWFGPVVVLLDCYHPSRRTDCDGPIKIVLDSLQGFAYRNDSQVALVAASKRLDRKNPRIEVTIIPLTADPELG